MFYTCYKWHYIKVKIIVVTVVTITNYQLLNLASYISIATVYKGLGN